ncbi:MAG TPA: tetratricopeptide repeat protein [Pyrinomonadaceae bacterium]
MQPLRRGWRRQFLLVVLIAALASTVSAQQLGNVTFENSGSKQAQASFLRGLAALHSFWYEEALDAFRESTRIDPDFMMGYWGEAMTYNHPLWSEQDAGAARLVIAKFRETPKLTQRERDYLNAVKLLYGDGEKGARDAAYSAAMEKIYRAYPDDLDAAAFYALSLLGLVRTDVKSFRLQAQAGAIALDVYQKNPNHPGAAHYIIHAFDDPDHAILALPAARRYAEIAPEAHHARHMPSHIFLQLGMWPEAAASNESAWQASDAWVKRKNLSITKRDYHSLHWLLYVYLQQGRYRKAEELLTLMKQTMSESTYDDKLRPGYYETNYANMAAAFVVETERWELAAKYFPPSSIDAPTADSTTMNGHSGHSASQSPGSAPTVSTDGLMTVRPQRGRQSLPLFIRGMADAVSGSAEAEKSLVALKALNVSGGGQATAMLGIRELEITALMAARRKDYDQAIASMKHATIFEEATGAPSGPPGLIKPSHELYGEILLQAGRPREAVEQFKVALLRQPNRARSLLGLARAAAKSGDQSGATAAYAKLLEQWQQADRDLPELRETQEYLKKATP